MLGREIEKDRSSDIVPRRYTESKLSTEEKILNS
jgi:hypothetical protein